MASTPSERLSLRLIGTGDFADTWGAELNSDTLALIDEAVSGVEEISLTGNITLSTTLYQTNQARNRVLRFTDGGLSSAPTIGLPSTERWYVIQNATGGTYALTFNNGSSSVSVAANIDTAIIWQTGSTLYGIDLAKGTDVATVAPEIANNNLQTVAGQIAPTNNLSTVAGISSDITTVANPTYKALVEVVGEATYKALVEVVGETNYKALVEVVGESVYKSLVETVGNATYKALVETVGETTYKALVETVGESVYKSVVETVGEAVYKAKVETVADATYKSQIEALNDVTYKAQLQDIATSPYKPIIETVGNATYKALVEVVGESTYKALVETVGNATYKAVVETVGESVYKGKVETVAGISNEVQSVANAEANGAVSAFGTIYQVSTNDPTARGNGATPLVAGDLAYVTSSSKLRIWNGTQFEDAGSAVSGLRAIHDFVATANQTVFPATGSIAYDQTAGGAAISVYLNGVLLKATDYTATNGTSITLASGVNANDEVCIHCFSTTQFANTYDQSQVNNLLAAKADLASPNFSGTPQISGANIITEVSQDTSPALGGDLQMGSFAISDGTLAVKNNGTPSELRLYCEAGSHYVSLKSPNHSAFSGNHSITMPPNTGNSGEFLKTDGNGVTSWAAAGGGSWDLLSTTTVTSSVASVTINGTAAGFDDATYGQYCIIFPYWQHSGSLGNARVSYLYTSGGSVLVAPRHKFSMAQHYNSYSQATDNSGNYITIGNGDGTTLSGQIFFTLANPPYGSGGNSAPAGTGGPRFIAQCAMDNNWFSQHGNRTMITHTAANAYETSYTYTGLRFYGEYGNITNAKFYLYGIKK